MQLTQKLTEKRGKPHGLSSLQHSGTDQGISPDHLPIMNNTKDQNRVLGIGKFSGNLANKRKDIEGKINSI